MSEVPAPKRFSLKLKVIPIPIESEQGVETTYYLKELTGAQRARYLNSFKDKTVDGVGQSGTRLKRFDGIITDLLGMCLYGPDAQDNLNAKPLPAQVIDQFPAAMQQELFDMAIDLSGLTGGGKDEKNA